MTAGEQLAHEAVHLGPYRLRGRLGEGGMGVVHLGIDPSGRAVAVKVLRAHVAHDPDARARLAREVSTLRRVRHPLVAEVLDADVDGEQPYVVTRFVPGSGLDAVVRDAGRLDADRLVRLGRGLSSALGAIHAAGVVHRDLKPANVLMLDGDPVVIDFGIAHVADDVRLTCVGLVMGTPGYLSPEVVDGDRVTPATDWWGWAATLAFAASGRPPYGRGPMDVVIDRVRRGSCDLSGVDERLRPLLAAALAVEPARRPHALEVLHALERYAMGEQATVTVALPRRTEPATRPQPALPTVTATTPHALREPAPPTTPAPSTTPATAPAARPATTPATQAATPPVRPPAPAPYAARPSAPPATNGSTPAATWPLHPVGPSPVNGPPLTPAPPGPVDAPSPYAAAPARTQRPRRQPATVLALLAAFVGAAAAWPVAALAVALVLMVLARTVERSTGALARRRYERGPRRSDLVLATVAWPWHLARSVLVGAFAALLPALMGLAAVFCTGLVVTRADGTPAPWSLPAVAAGALVALVASWWGPGGSALRRGTRTVLRAVVPPSEQVVVVLVLVLVAAGCAYYAVQQGHPSWWPVDPQQLPSVLRLP
jgi:serine/threonine protein kinase